MDLAQVRYFLAVCKYGSFTAAAAALGVSQPSVTTGVRRLERVIGGKLLERHHPVRMTELGAKVHPFCEDMQVARDLMLAAAGRLVERSVPIARGGGVGGGMAASDQRTRHSPHQVADQTNDIGMPVPSVEEKLDQPPRMTGGALESNDIIARSRKALERADRATVELGLVQEKMLEFAASLQDWLRRHPADGSSMAPANREHAIGGFTKSVIVLHQASR